MNHRIFEIDLPALIALVDVQLADDDQSTALNPKTSPYGSSKHRREPKDWDAGLGMPEYLNLLRHGWPEGAARMKQLQDASPPPAQNAAAMRYVHDYAGQRPDVPRYIGGDMRSMIRRGSEFTPSPVRSIAFDLSTPWTVRARDMIGRALAYCELVETLDAQGIDCDVYGVFFWSNEGRKSTLMVKIKSAGQHVQRETFAATLGHPCFVRRLAFRWQECEPDRWPSHGNHPHNVAYLTQLNATAGFLPPNVDVYSINCGRLEDCRKELADQEPVRCPV